MPSPVRLRREVLAAREQLAEDRRRLRLQHDSGSPGIQVCNRLTDLVDTILLDLYRAALADAASGMESLVTLVAHGGYGRRDLAPFSDVDLMFLYPAGFEAGVLAFIQRLNQDIVDAGLTLGSSFRTPEYACGAALQDATIFTSLCESRFLGGDSQLFTRFFDLFRRRAQRRTAAIIDQIEQVSSNEALAMAREVIKKEGIPVGISSGAAIFTRLAIAAVGRFCPVRRVRSGESGACRNADSR